MAFDHFNLTRPPFSSAADPAFHYEDAARRELLGALHYALKQGDGVIKLTGEPGSGKRMLCQVLAERLAQAAMPVQAVLLAPGGQHPLSPLDAVCAIARQLGLAPGGLRSDEVMRLLHTHLTAEHATDKLAVLLVEQAHTLPLDTLETLRQLTNLSVGPKPLLPVVLVGTPELNQVLRQPRLRQLRERITLSFVVPPLPPELVPELLASRLRAAGHPDGALFQLDAARLIARTADADLHALMALAERSLAVAAAASANAVALFHVRDAIKGVATRPGSEMAPSVASAAMLPEAPAAMTDAVTLIAINPAEITAPQSPDRVEGASAAAQWMESAPDPDAMPETAPASALLPMQETTLVLESTHPPEPEPEPVPVPLPMLKLDPAPEPRPEPEPESKAAPEPALSATPAALALAERFSTASAAEASGLQDLTAAPSRPRSPWRTAVVAGGAMLAVAGLASAAFVLRPAAEPVRAAAPVPPPAPARPPVQMALPASAPPTAAQVAAATDQEPPTAEVQATAQVQDKQPVEGKTPAQDKLQTPASAQGTPTAQTTTMAKAPALSQVPPQVKAQVAENAAPVPARSSAASQEATASPANATATPPPRPSAPATTVRAGKLLQQSLLASKSWLRDEPENNYCVQIANFAADETERAEQFLSDTHAAIGLSQVHSYPMLIKGEPRIAIVYGSFASAKKVQEVQANLAEQSGARHKIRTIKGIREAVKQARQATAARTG